MSMLTKEKEKVLTIDQIYGEFLSAEMVSNQNETSIVTFGYYYGASDKIYLWKKEKDITN